MGINSYGISLTTLEEVFLRIGLEEKVERDEKESNSVSEITDLGKDQEKIKVALEHETKGHSFIQQLKALLMKRYLMYRRDVRGIIFTFVLPLVFLILSSLVISGSEPIVRLFSFYL